MKGLGAGPGKKQKIVVVGGSFGGLTVAHALRRLLPGGRREIAVISKDERFVFMPSLPWVALGRRTLEESSFPIGPSRERRSIEFVTGAVTAIDAARQAVKLASGRCSSRASR